MTLALLVVDDDEVDRRAVRRAVQAAGVDAAIREVEGPEEALAALQAGGIDCVLLDFYLPRMDGLEVLRLVRAGGGNVPVIMLTGQGDEQLAVTLMREGAADYLSKQTLTPDRLERSLRHALAIARAEEERRQLLAREQAAREEAQAANRAKDEFLATLSHELRTPLNAILGWVRLLTSGSLDAAASARALETIERNTVVQVKLIDDLLDISRVVTGKLQLDLRPLLLSTLVHSVVDSFVPNAAGKGVTLRYREHGPERPVIGDQARVQQVLSNLISNAMKFTPAEGSVEVALSFDANTARICIADTGAGISPDFLPHVFDRFRQADATATRRHGGLGLGLSIVRHLVEMHGGTVSAESAGVDRGASFTVVLPLVRTGAPVDDQPPANGELPSLEGLHVLVVDDEADSRELLATVLERHGARVTVAGSAAEAIQTVKSCCPDVMLSDVAMPEHDGYSLIRQIRALLPDRPFPAAAITAYASPGDRARALLAGFQAHLPKPVEPREIVAVVAALSGRTAASSVARRD